MRNHPERADAIRAAYGARQNSAPGAHYKQAEFIEKCDLLGNVCVYCGEAKPLTADHVIPLSRKELWHLVPLGADDITNIVPACQSCNSRKGTKTAKEYITYCERRRSTAPSSPADTDIPARAFPSTLNH